MRPPPDAAIPPLPFLQQKFKVSAIQQNNKRVQLYSVAICRSHDFLVSGLPHAGLGDDRGHRYRGVVAHPPLHHVLFGGQQLVQSPLPKRNSASLFSKYLDPIFLFSLSGASSTFIHNSICVPILFKNLVYLSGKYPLHAWLL